MKRIIASTTNTSIMSSKTGMFELFEYESIGRNDTPFKDLRVKSYGAADKHVVEIRFNVTRTPKFDGSPAQYQFADMPYVSHGMRGQIDTIADTQEYIKVLEEAVVFCYEISRWLTGTGADRGYYSHLSNSR